MDPITIDPRGDRKKRLADHAVLVVQLDGNGNAVPAQSASASTGLPYGADNYAVTYYGSTNNVETIVYKRGSTTLKTRTLSYAGGGSADNDKLTGSVDS